MKPPVVIWAVILIGGSATARGAGPPGYDAEEAGRLRRAVTLENWDDGGEISRFVYLHVSEVFPVAVVGRGGGPVSPLPGEGNPAVGRYVVDREGGRSLTLDDVVRDGPFDGFVVIHRGRIV